MNREIEFRGKHIDKWVYGYLVKSVDDNKFYITVSTDQFYQVKDNTIGQYTGLKDENSKKIFEGDIVNYTIGKPNGDSVDIENEIVKFDYMQLVQLEYSSYLKVIGNIYENNLESQV